MTVREVVGSETITIRVEEETIEVVSVVARIGSRVLPKHKEVSLGSPPDQLEYITSAVPSDKLIDVISAHGWIKPTRGYEIRCYHHFSLLGKGEPAVLSDEVQVKDLSVMRGCVNIFVSQEPR